MNSLPVHSSTKPERERKEEFGGLEGGGGGFARFWLEEAHGYRECRFCPLLAEKKMMRSSFGSGRRRGKITRTRRGLPAPCPPPLLSLSFSGRGSSTSWVATVSHNTHTHTRPLLAVGVGALADRVFFSVFLETRKPSAGTRRRTPRPPRPRPTDAREKEVDYGLLMRPRSARWWWWWWTVRTCAGVGGQQRKVANEVAAFRCWKLSGG